MLFCIYILDQKSDKAGSHPASDDRAALVHEESEPSDDELLSLSSQHSNTSGEKHHGTPKHKKVDPPAPAAPPEDVDLLCLGGSAVNTAPSQPKQPPSNSDLLSDLFGAAQAPGDAKFPAGGAGSAGSAHSTPRRSAASPSPSQSPRVGEGIMNLLFSWFV